MTGEFCDNKVLVFAYDRTAGQKHETARELIARLWNAGDGVISVQVLQELFVALTGKIPRPVQAADAREIVGDIAAWRVVEPNARDVLAAIDGASRWQISFWDAMILTAANRAGAATVWSEDLNDGQTYDGVTVRNPFVTDR
jgi:predicted nucleic acid-binding protein